MTKTILNASYFDWSKRNFASPLSIMRDFFVVMFAVCFDWRRYYKRLQFYFLNSIWKVFRIKFLVKCLIERFKVKFSQSVWLKFVSHFVPRNFNVAFKHSYLTNYENYKYEKLIKFKKKLFPMPTNPLNEAAGVH